MVNKFNLTTFSSINECSIALITSDTGKSYIYRSIEYLFGKETAKNPFDNNYGDDQIIIIENTNDHDLPNILVDDKNIKIIKFTQKNELGRYGFLDDIKRE